MLFFTPELWSRLVPRRWCVPARRLENDAWLLEPHRALLPIVAPYDAISPPLTLPPLWRTDHGHRECGELCRAGPTNDPFVDVSPQSRPTRPEQQRALLVARQSGFQAV